MDEHLQNKITSVENSTEEISEKENTDITFNATDNIEELSLSSLFDEKSSTYTKLSEKYEDMMSSASTMLFVGIAGIIFLVLIYLKIIPFPMNGSTTWLFDLVMCSLFIVFIIAGIVSFFRAKQLKLDADAEDEIITDILSWSEKNIKQETLDEGLDSTQPEEILYFSRFERIKDIIMHEFEDADETLIEDLSETVYQNIYEKDEI